jgi:hypothetical protein
MKRNAEIGPFTKSSAVAEINPRYPGGDIADDFVVDGSQFPGEVVR